MRHLKIRLTAAIGLAIAAAAPAAAVQRIETPLGRDGTYGVTVIVSEGQVELASLLSGTVEYYERDGTYITNDAVADLRQIATVYGPGKYTYILRQIFLYKGYYPSGELRAVGFRLYSAVAIGTDTSRFTQTVTYLAAVPEPATWMLMALGFGAVGVAGRRRRAATAT